MLSASIVETVFSQKLQVPRACKNHNLRISVQKGKFFATILRYNYANEFIQNDFGKAGITFSRLWYISCHVFVFSLAFSSPSPISSTRAKISSATLPFWKAPPLPLHGDLSKAQMFYIFVIGN